MSKKLGYIEVYQRGTNTRLRVRDTNGELVHEMSLPTEDLNGTILDCLAELYIEG